MGRLNIDEEYYEFGLGTPSLWNIFGLQKNVHFLGGIMVGRSGNGCPPTPII